MEKVSRKKIEEVTNLVKKLQSLTGRKVSFGDTKPVVKESKEEKIKKINALIKLIESKTGKKVVFEKVIEKKK